MMNEIEPVTEDTIAREEAKLTPEDLERIRKALQLWRAQMLCLWKICPKAACRRAHDCSVDPDFCVERFAALVSEDVHVALDVLHDAKYFGYSYDDACALAPPGSIEAYDVWLAKLFLQESALTSRTRPIDAKRERLCIAITGLWA